MTIAFYILQTYQLGNSIHRNVEKISEQPKDGFPDKGAAIIHLKALMDEGILQFGFQGIITEIYSA